MFVAHKILHDGDNFRFADHSKVGQTSRYKGMNQGFCEVRIGAGGTTISTSPVATSYTRPDIRQAPGKAGIARSSATSKATAARGSLTAFVLSSPSCI